MLFFSSCGIDMCAPYSLEYVCVCVPFAHVPCFCCMNVDHQTAAVVPLLLRSHSIVSCRLLFVAGSVAAVVGALERN